MTESRPVRMLLLPLCALAALLVAYPVGVTASASRPNPLTDAWERAREAGGYDFTADVEQTLIPRPIPSMIGQTDLRIDIRMEGQVTPPDQARISLRFEGAGLDGPALTLLREGAATYLLRDGERVLVENPVGVSSPTADYLGYLAAAEDVQVCEPSEGALVCYAYVVNGPRFAEHVRQQMEAELRESEHPLPPGMKLAPSPLMQHMVGHGQLWIDADGFPVRQIVDLEMPEVSEEYDARARVIVDFRFSAEDRARVLSANQMPESVRPFAGNLGGLRSDNLRRLIRKSEFNAQPLDLACLLYLASIAAVVLLCRRRRWLYGLIAVGISVILVLSPVLEAAGVVRFHARQAHAASTSALGEAMGLPAEEAVSLHDESRMADPAPEPTAKTSGQVRLANPDSYCGQGSTSEDEDGDGLNDAAEYCLGTDPKHEDTDRDLITDTLEIDGFDSGGEHWTSDPFQVDSNLDGLSDLDEWPEPVGAAPDLSDVADAWDPDDDGVPNLWDEDNDGDEVPDGLDLSPYARSAYSESLSLSLHGGGAGDYVYVEIQIQPEDMDHLRYSTGYLDWPHDERGQLRDLDDSEEDIRLIPVLRIYTNQEPDRGLLRNEGVAAFEDDGDYVLYIAPSPVTDGGRIVAFYTTLAYHPEQVEDLRWDRLELVWMPQMSMDQEVNGEVKTTVIPLTSYLEESIRVTGLQITVSRYYQSAILGTPAHPDEDRWLFNLLFGLSNTFLTHKHPNLQEIEHRFTSPNTPITNTWGVPIEQVAMDLPASAYGHMDEAIADHPTRIRSFLDDHGYPIDSTPSLLMASQYEMGVNGLDDQGALEPEARFDLNLADVPVSTLRSLKSTTYEYEHGGHTESAWESLDLAQTLEVMRERYKDGLLDILEDLQEDYPDLTEEDLKLVLDMFYTAWFVGQTRIISLDGQPMVPDSRPDEEVYDQLRHDRDNAPAYLIEATHLGEPGAGLKVGDSQTQSYRYYRELDDSGISVGFVPASAIVLGLTSIRVIKTIFAVRTTLQAVRFARAVGSFAGRMRVFSNNAGAGGRWLGLIGAILAVASLWTMFFVTAYGTGWDWDSPAVKFAAAYASVATVLTVVLFAISLNPIGAVVVGILSLLDLLCFGATWLFMGEGFSFMNWIITGIAELFYSVDVLTRISTMDFADFDTALLDEERGLLVGNRYRFSAEFVGRIAAGDEGTRGDMDDSWIEADLEGRASGEAWVNKTGGRECSDTWWWDKTCRNDVAVEWRLDTVKRNLKLSAESSVDAKTFYQECTLGICSRKDQDMHLPGDLEDEDEWEPINLYVDVLPDNVHDLWNWGDLANPDPDGDGLKDHGARREEASLGTNPFDWDTDDDGLSDRFEHDYESDLGTVATEWDSDGDGLSDGLEYRIGTQIDNADTDEDGLEDGDEVFHLAAGGDWAGGWPIQLPGRAQPVWIFSNPLFADIDGDGLKDLSERNAVVSPHGYNDSPHLTLEPEPLAESPSGTEGVYVALSNEVTVDLTLENTSADPIASTLTLCLPDFLTDLQFEPTLSGDRHPATGPAASCHGLEWSFAAPSDTLLEDQIVSTTVTATVTSLVASASGHVTASLPFRVGDAEDEVVDQFAVIVDLDDPEATISAPSDGALLGGGISHFVIGGSASDEASWVTRVDVDLPNEGWAEAEGISPWAYTWELPDDGHYALQARSRDYLEREGTSAIVNVIVDNTPPDVSLALEDGQVVTSQSSDAVSITLGGVATDTLVGLVRVQVSTDERPWREVWAEPGAPATAVWSTTWTLPNQETAQGEHTVAVRAVDLVGNWSEPVRRTIIVDVVPPTSELTDRSYLLDPPPHVAVGEPLDLYGVANDAGRVPDPPRPMELVGDLDSLDDATVWLELSSVTDDDRGVSVAWIGDFDADGLGDAVVGLPAAEDDRGEVTIVYGRAGGWPTPTDAEVLAHSPTSFVGVAGARIGGYVAPAGDVNGDGLSDLLIGDPGNDRVFLVFGQPGPLGRGVVLDEPRVTTWSVIDLAGLGSLSGLSTGGDVNGDGLDEVLIGATDTYLLLGEVDPWWAAVPLAVRAAAVIQGTPGSPVAGVGDMDGDEYDEFVVVLGSTVYLFEGRDGFAPGTGAPSETLSPAEDAIGVFVSSDVQPTTVGLGDVNGDSLADFVYDDGDQPVVVFGDAGRVWTTHALAFSPAPSGFLAAPGDVDADGLADLFVGNEDGDANLVLGKNLWVIGATLADVRAAASTPYPAGADLNGDGSSDLLLVPGELGVTVSGTPDYGQPPHVDPDELPVSRVRSVGDLSEPERLKSLLQITRYVNDDGTCAGAPCYADIQDAVDAASDGDTISVEPGVYGSVTVAGKDDLEISGIHPDAVFVDGGGGDFAVKIEDADGVKLEKLTLRNADEALYLDSAGVGGYDDPAKRIDIQRLLVYDFDDHALTMDRISSLKLSRSTLAGGDDHINLAGAADPAMDASWSEVSTDSGTATTGEGGFFADAENLYFVDDAAQAGAQIDVYNPGTHTWSDIPDAPQGVHAAVASDPAGHLWALRKDLGVGFDGPIYAMAYISPDEIYVGGEFHHAGAVEADYVAKWDGSAWAAVGEYGQPPDGPVHALKVGGDYVYAGGTSGLHCLGCVSGDLRDWDHLGGIAGAGAVFALELYGDDVYVGGSFDDIGGVSAHKLARWRSGGSWTLTGAQDPSCNGIRGTHVSALVKKDGWLYLGGHFFGMERSYYNPRCYTSDDVHLARIWLGSSHTSSKPTDYGYDLNERAHVYALANAGDNLLVGGDFSSVFCREDDEGHKWCGGAGMVRNLALLKPDGTWSLPSYLKTDAPPVRAVHVAGNRLTIGGDFMRVGVDTAAERVAYYDSFPGGGGAWHTIDGGADDTVHAVVHDSGHTYIGGAFNLLGTDPAFGYAHWDGTQWVGLTDQAFYKGNGASWLPRSVLPDFVGGGASIVSDGEDCLYVVPGGGSSKLYRYDIISDAWEALADMPGGVGAGGGLAWTGDHLYALGGGGGRALYGYDPNGDEWETLTPSPNPGPVVDEGGGLAWDGRGCLYVLTGGNGIGFLRYHLQADEWEVLPDAPDLVNAGGGLARIGQNVYGVPGGGQELWSYDPVGVYPQKLTLDHVAFVAPEGVPNPVWINLTDLVIWPDDFVVGGSDNGWAASPGAAWSPEPILDGSALLTHDDARLLDPERDVYRVGSGTKLDGGYHTYRPYYAVEPCEGPDCDSPTPIQSRINSGANRVLIRPGTYEESFYLISGVEVVGEGADLTIVKPGAGGASSAIVRAEGVVGAKLTMLTLDGAGGSVDGLSVEDGARDVVLKQTIIRGADTGIRATGGETELEVVNNTVVRNDDGMVAAHCAPVDVRNTIFAHHTDTGLTYEGCAIRKLHKYNLFWDNTIDLNPADPAPGELFLDPLFVDPGPPAHDYHVLDGSPVIDAGDPGDPPPPGAGARVDIGYVDQNRAGLYVDDDYCESCPNDGLSWQVDAFDVIQDALDRAADNIHQLRGLHYAVAVAAGTYTETLSVPSHVRLVGAGPEETIIDARTISGPAVTFDGVVGSEMTGFTVKAHPESTGVSVMGSSNSVTITRNIIETWNSVGTASGVAFSGRATGQVSFNTLIDYSSSGPNHDSAVSSSGVGSWVSVQNNIASGEYHYSASWIPCQVEHHTRHGYGLRTVDHGQIFNAYNLLWVDRQYQDDAGTGLEQGPGEPAFAQPCFDPPGYRLKESSQARDAASPLAEVPPGGGDRADMGYHELTAAPASIFLGREDVSSAVGNSGVSEVEVGLSQVGDPGSPVTDTLPGAWDPVVLDTPEQAVSYWSTSFTPTQNGLYRLYSRGTDVAGNEEGEEADWYEGGFVADSIPPVVTWTLPASGAVVATPLQLRAEVYDYCAGEFSVDDTYFVVGGDQIEAEWAADPWDEEGQEPRTFRAWVDLGAGLHADAEAVAVDRAGNVMSDTISFTVSGSAGADTVSPTLIVLSPIDGAWFTRTVVFSGTVVDAGSGVAAVEVGLDGGFTWEPATVDGADWALTWEAPEDHEFISYPAAVRARDQAGNAAQQALTFSIDNVAPLGPQVESFTARAVAVPFERDAPPGTHFDLPSYLIIDWAPPVDGSGVASCIITVDQLTETLPSLDLGTVTSYTHLLNAPGDWYVHLGVRDLLGNRFTRHYGPWHVGTVADLTTLFKNRVQTIKVDGEIDLDWALEEWHDIGWEWGIFEFMGDVERSGVNPDWWGPQQLFTAWDGASLYLGWAGAWWALDGEMWAYLDAAVGGCSQPVSTTTGCAALPFDAEYAINVTSSTSGTLWECSGSTWGEANEEDWEFAQGDGGDTEIRLPIDWPAIPHLGLLAYALDDAGDPWAVFPTSNPLTNLCSQAYQWANLGQILQPNANQPLGIQVGMALDVLLAPFAPSCPGDLFDIVVELQNHEVYTIPDLGMDLDLSPGLDLQGVNGAPPSGPLTFEVPLLAPGAARSVTVTMALADDICSLVNSAPVSMSVGISSLPPLSLGWSRLIDCQPPTVTVVSDPTEALRPLYGTASDEGGTGVAGVEYRLDGGAWQPVSGTLFWSADYPLPTATTWQLDFRVWDQCGSSQAIGIPFTDATAPTLTVESPPVVSLGPIDVVGMATDLPSGGEVVKAEVQIDGGAWHLATLGTPGTGGAQEWQFVWEPPAPGITYTIRARGTDLAGNVGHSDPYQVHVSTSPTADAGPDQIVDQGTLVTLDGSGSHDADGDPLTYGWTQTGGPFVALSDPAVVSPTFVAPLTAGPLTFTLSLTDSWGLTDADMTVVTVRQPDLEVAKSVSDYTPRSGESITYTVTVSNTGPGHVAGAVIRDELPSGVTYASDDGGGAYDASSGVWAVGALGPGAAATLCITVTVDAVTPGTLITNTATISMAGWIDPRPENDLGEAVIAAQHPDAVIITVTPQAGGTLIYVDGQGYTTTVEAPVGAVSETITLILTPLEGPTHATAPLLFAGHAFTLEVYKGPYVQPGYVFDEPFTITIDYSDEDVDGIDEETLTLLVWAGSEWEDAACDGYLRNLEENWLSTEICHLSEFGLLGEGRLVGVGGATLAVARLPGLGVRAVLAATVLAILYTIAAAVVVRRE